MASNRTYFETGKRGAQPQKIEKRFEKIKKDSLVSSVLNKMTSANDTAQRGGRAAGYDPSSAFFRQVSDMASRNVTDSHMIFQLLPDMQLAMQILVSSILSPKDLVHVEINYSTEEGVLDSELSSALLKVISNYFNNTYKIKKILPTMLEAALFKRGSYPMVVLSENAIDDIINNNSVVSTESIRTLLDDKFNDNGVANCVGILGPADASDKISMESWFSDPQSAGRNYESRVFNQATATTESHIDLMVDVTDNPDALRMPGLMDRFANKHIQDTYQRGILRYSEEALKVDPSLANDKHIRDKIYPHRRFKNAPVQHLSRPDEYEDENAGHPVIMYPPSESVIPVFVPGTPSEHVGYFLVLDQSGNPISTANREDYYSQLTDNLSSESDITNTLRDVKMQTQGINRSNDQMQVEEAASLYTDIVEKELVNRLRNGIYGSEVKLSRPDEIYRVMLSRALSGQRTQLLYIPQECMTYVAFDYNEVGLGVSLLEKTKILSVMRILTLFANTTSGIRNSITQTKLNIDLDEKDSNPQKTVEDVVHQATLLRGNDFPVRSVHMQDMRDYFAQAGMSVNVTGNPRYPDMNVDIDDTTQNKATVDRDYEESLRDRHIQGIGLAPEILAMFRDADFATSIVSSNLLLSKTVMGYQDSLMWFVRDFIIKTTTASGTLMEKLTDVVVKNKSKAPKAAKKDGKDTNSIVANTLEIFFDNLNITLPEPDHAALENQIENLDIYVRGLDQALEAYVSRDILDREAMPEGMSDLSDHLEQAIRAYFIRQWLRNNGAYSELDQLIEKDGEGDFLFKVLEDSSEYLGDMKEQMFEYAKNILKSRKEFGDKFQEYEDKLNETDEEEEGDGPAPAGEPQPQPTGAPPEEPEPEPPADDDDEGGLDFPDFEY